MSTALGNVTDTTYWAQNSIVASYPASGDVFLTQQANGEFGGLCYKGSALGLEGTLKVSFSWTGTSAQHYIGFVDSSVTPSTVDGNSIPASFTGLHISDLGTGQANRAEAYYSGTQNSTFLTTFNYGLQTWSNYFRSVRDPGVLGDYYVSFGVNGSTMTIKLFLDSMAQDALFSWTGTTPSYSTMLPVIFSKNGGSFGGTCRASGVPVWYDSSEIPAPGGLIRKNVGSTTAFVGIPTVPTATSYDWRVNGGSSTNVSDTNYPSIQITGLTSNSANTLEIRAKNGSNTTGWTSYAIRTSSTCYWLDDFTRADATSPLGTPSIGTGYTAVAGTWGIKSNAAYTSAATASAVAIITGSGAADVDICVAINCQNSTVRRGALFRYTDVNNYWGIMFDTANGVYVQKRVSSTNTTMMAVNTSISPTYARVVAVGRYIYLFIGEALVDFCEDPSLQSATGLGMLVNNDNTLTIEAISASSPYTDPTGSASLSPTDYPVSDTVVAGDGGRDGFLYRGRDSKAADISGET